MLVSKMVVRIDNKIIVLNVTVSTKPFISRDLILSYIVNQNISLFFILCTKTGFLFYL